MRQGTRQGTKIVTGIHLVAKPRSGGQTRWYLYAWRGGPCIHRADGPRPVIGPELLALALAARAERGGSSTSRHPETFDAVIDAYRAGPEFARLAPATQRDYRLWLDRLSARFGTAPLAAFADPRMRRTILDWRDGWARQPRTADKAAVMIATVLGWAVERGLLAVNVAAKIRQLHHADKSDQVWEPRHWQSLETWHVATRKPVCPPQLADALKLASLTGLRLGDLVRLSWDQVGDQAIVVVTRKRKGRAVIPILPDLRAHLDAREHRSGAILRNSRGQAWTESGLGTVFQRSKPAGFDRTIHDLRGTYITWLATRGLTDDEIARIVGWTAKRIGQIRSRYVDEARVVISLVERLSA